MFNSSTTGGYIKNYMKKAVDEFHQQLFSLFSFGSDLTIGDMGFTVEGKNNQLYWLRKE